MTTKQKLEIKQSKARERLAALLKIEKRSDAETTELGATTDRLQELEVEVRAAIFAEDAEVQKDAAEGKDAGDGLDGLDAEGRELEKLRNKAKLGRFLQAAAGGDGPRDGPEKELREAEGHTDARILPWCMLDPRKDQENGDVRQAADAATSAPANVGRSQEMILGRVFANTAASFLGVMMPSVPVGERVYPVISSGAEGETLAKGSAKDAEQAAFEVRVLSPKRLHARYIFRTEDSAAFQGLESALRTDLSGALGEALDKAILVGDGTEPNVSGFFNRDPEPVDATDTASQSQVRKAIAGEVDGRYAMKGKDVSLLVGSPTYAFWAGSVNSDSDATALKYIEDLSYDLRVSAHVPAAAGDLQEALSVRGYGSAVAPMWSSRLIRDEYSGASKGEVALDLVMLFAFDVVRSSWKRHSFKLA